MSVRLEAAPDRGFKIRTVRPKSGRMATLKCKMVLHRKCTEVHIFMRPGWISESSFVVFSSYEESWLHSRPVICILLLRCVVCVYMLCGLVDCHTDRLSAACAGVFHTFIPVPSFSGSIINDGRPVFRVHTWHHSHHARCPHKQLWDHQTPGPTQSHHPSAAPDPLWLCGVCVQLWGGQLASLSVPSQHL